eukprot:CAMPEP_0119041928 /NCGR_PEP_ID=MMETSP1177-20130426/14215_1 /TAXON_ID=2985 /ORGANISM="Ochromonas sp, Strain CCMP1899" /LENGTH=227 /DNA_ID=CAMNT_0007008359 /DNA_START=231 /DNA_END=914 /DNA_ORIENTATION=-
MTLDANVADLERELTGLKGTKTGERLEIVEGENILLKKQVVTLKEEVVTLKEEVVTLKEKIVTLTTDFSDFKTEKKKSSDLILLFDLVCLFRLYFIQPNLSASAKHNTWGQLCQSITDATDALEDGIISDAAYRTLLTEWNSYSPDVDIILLKKWSTKRHDIAHSSMRIVDEQQNFIALLKLQNFADPAMDELRLQLLASLTTLSAGDLRRNKSTIDENQIEENLLV